MTILVDWPSSILIPSQESWRLAGASRSGGRSADGEMEQVVASASPYWVASLRIPVNTMLRRREYRAMLGLCDGRANPIRIGPVDIKQAPWGPGGAAPALTLAADAARRAVSLTLARTAGGEVARGHYFSLADRLYLIVASEDDGVAESFDVTIRPPLRAAATAGATLTFVKPVSTMRLARDDTGELDLELSQFGTATLDLVEYPPEP